MSSIKDANFALWIVPERYPTRIGEFCRSETGRPARYIGYGKCVFISESSAEFLVSDALPPEGKEAEHSYVNDAGIAPYVDVLKRLMRQLDTKLPVEFPFKLELTKDGRTF